MIGSFLSSGKSPLSTSEPHQNDFLSGRSYRAPRWLRHKLTPVLELGVRFKPLVELTPQRMQLKVVANTECATVKAMWLDS